MRSFPDMFSRTSKNESVCFFCLRCKCLAFLFIRFFQFLLATPFLRRCFTVIHSCALSLSPRLLPGDVTLLRMTTAPFPHGSRQNNGAAANIFKLYLSISRTILSVYFRCRLVVRNANSQAPVVRAARSGQRYPSL